MIIVVSRLLFWFAIFRSEDRTNDEYTWITWRFKVKSVTFDPWNETGKMIVHPSRLKISSISGSIGAIDGVGELNPDTLTTRSLRKYQEPSVSHRIGDGNDFTDRVVNRRNSYLFVIRVRDHISKIHVVENDLIGCEQNSEGSDGWVPMLVRIDPLERAVGKQTLDKHGMMHGLSLTTTKRKMVRVVSPS